MKKGDNEFYTEPDVNEVGRDPRLNLSLKILRQVKDSLENVILMLESGSEAHVEEAVRELMNEKQRLDADVAEATGLRTIEGVFDGTNMVGSDGNVYNVPPNYASKSRLVEGDLMKLTIKKDGSFVFKQIGPIERKRVVGKLSEDVETGDYLCSSADGQWRLIRASVTYY
ncbi:MAG: hypothetical protein AAB865_01605, partial [Patescibacteria group bacterium]